MPAFGALGGASLGPNVVVPNAAIVGFSTFAMAALNAGCCFRFMAKDTRDIASVYVNWSSVSAPGTVQARIETIDTTTGKPTGSLYDANAVLSFTPSTGGTNGWQILTFATLPTTGLVAGNEYAIVLLTTVGGTTQTIRHAVTSTGRYPAATLTAANGTTRSNFAEVNSAAPIYTIVYEDGVEECDGGSQYATSSSFDVYGTRAWGTKITIASQVAVRGISSQLLARSGTPGNLKFVILDSTDVQIAGAAVTVSKNSMNVASGKQMEVYFPNAAAIVLQPGVYRVIMEQTDTTTTSTNYFRGWNVTARSAALVPQSRIRTSTVDYTIAHPTWVDTNTDETVMTLILDDLPGAIVASQRMVASIGTY